MKAATGWPVATTPPRPTAIGGARSPDHSGDSKASQTLASAQSSKPSSCTNWGWQAYRGSFQATIDLGEERAIREVKVGFLRNRGNDIDHPETVALEIPSDGQTFESVAMLRPPVTLTARDPLRWYAVVEDVGRAARYVRVRALAAGEAWLFVDEIIVRD